MWIKTFLENIYFTLLFLDFVFLSHVKKEGIFMLTRAEAWKLLTEYNQDPFHLRHALTVEGVMRYFARELGYGAEEDFWGIVGLLHDLDFEKYPEEHLQAILLLRPSLLT